MKSILALLFLILFPSLASAQTTKNFKNIDPLPAKAFDLMIVQDITYAISGEATPTTGIKVDITKPEGTISGSFGPKKHWVPWSLFTFELKGGVTDRSFNLFKGFSSANSAYEIRPSFHFTRGNSSKYGHNPEATRKKLVVYAKNEQVNLHSQILADSFAVISRIREIHLMQIDQLQNTPKPGQPMAQAVPYQTVVPDDKKHRRIAIHFLKRILKKDNLNVDENTKIDDIFKELSVATLDSSGNLNAFVATYNDQVSIIYRKYEGLQKNCELTDLNKMIANSSEIWTQKTYQWWTVSPFIRTEKVNEFFAKYQNKDSSYFKSDYRFFFGFNGYYNRYIVVPKKVAQLFRLGLAISRSNNLTSLSSYNYEVRDPFFTYGKSVTEKTKTGTAYNHSDIQQGWLKQLTAEYYLLPLKSLIPGLYISSNINQSKLYNLINFKDRQNDQWQIGVEGGLVFNINSREKDKEKSVLSILAYIRHEDVTDSQRTSLKTNLTESSTDFKKRNISVGLRVGIPITLPQRSE
jgi:hypothetical protein